MKAFYLFFLYLLFTATYIIAKPVGCFGTGTDDLKQCKPKIAKSAPKDAKVLKLSSTDHKTFVNTNERWLAESKQAASHSQSTGAPGSDIPHTRSAAYIEHNLKVLDKVKPGDKIAISRSKSTNNTVYHPVKEVKPNRIMNLFSSKK